MQVIFFLILASLNSQLAIAEENKIFLYNRIEFCKANEYFDINYFKCVSCDSNLNLIVADDCKSACSIYLRIMSLLRKIKINGTNM